MTTAIELIGLVILWHNLFTVGMLLGQTMISYKLNQAVFP